MSTRAQQRCDSDLTKRARDVLAGLSPVQRGYMARADLHLGIVNASSGVTGPALARRGLCEGHRLTDLGREVARLIQEENCHA